jgi:transposase
MSGRKGMVHYKVEIKQEAVRLILEENQTYSAVAAKLEIGKAERIKAWVRMYRQEGDLSFHKPLGRPLKAQAQERELEGLRRENTLLKKFRTELRGVRLAQRKIGRSSTTKKSSR